jgi:hypothetical protein
MRSPTREVLPDRLATDAGICLLANSHDEPKAGIVVIVTGAGAARKAAGNDMSGVLDDDVGHVMPHSR